MKVQRLTRALEVRRPRDEVFAFFADPFTLEVVSPPWLGLRIEEPPTGPLGEGTTFVYSLRLHGIPFRWLSRIVEWNPPHRFVHEQVEGPYLRWIHQHRFDDVTPLS